MEVLNKISKEEEAQERMKKEGLGWHCLNVVSLADELVDAKIATCEQMSFEISPCSNHQESTQEPFFMNELVPKNVINENLADFQQLQDGIEDQPSSS